MSDTMTVKTLCDHGRADPHHMNLGTAVCPGGREIVLRELYFPVDAWQEVDDDE